MPLKLSCTHLLQRAACAEDDDSGGAGAPAQQQQQQGPGQPPAADVQQQQGQQQPAYMLDAVEEDPDRELHSFEVEPAKASRRAVGCCGCMPAAS